MNGDVTVREAMTRDYVGVSESDSITETASLLLEEEVPGAVVLRGHDPIGIITARDVLSWLVREDDDGATVADCMTETVPEIDPERPIVTAVDEMFAQATHLLVVTDNGGEPVGMLTQEDVVAATTLTPTSEPPEREVEPARVESEEDTPAEANSGYSEQGICERCGALTSDLVSFNGQLLCADCRDV